MHSLKRIPLRLIGVGAAALLGFAGTAQARDYISIVGSSTVYPFATVVAENFGKTTSFKTPKIESTGSGGGFKLFCQGVGVDTPDITNASRAIKASEIKTCKKNGVNEIIEVKIGYDGIAVANSRKGPALKLTRKELFLALAKSVPDPKGGKRVVPNPYKTWHDVNPDLPKEKIEVLGPPPTSGTRDAFTELVMEAGCEHYDWIEALKKSDKSKFKQICLTLREDGGYIEAGENDNLIVQKLVANPNAVGIFGFSFLEENEDKIQGSSIDGVKPSFDTIADGSYPVSRPLFFYVKKAHIGTIPGMEQYLAEFTSDAAWGEYGYLSERGLIPMPAAERKKYAQAVKTLQAMK